MRFVFVAVAAWLAGTGSAVSQTLNSITGVTIESSAGVVSDYRFRGVSLSNEKPAFQLETTLSHHSGWYASAFTSTIGEYGADADGDGARAEIDISGGWAFSVAGFDIDAGATGYFYPDASDVNYYVIPVSISRAFGDLAVTAGYEYTPAQHNLADMDGSYVWLGAEWATRFSPVSLSACVGHEEGAWAGAGKSDWTIGAAYSLARFQLGLSWTGADDDAHSSALVAALSSRF